MTNKPSRAAFLLMILTVFFAPIAQAQKVAGKAESASVQKDGQGVTLTIGDHITRVEIWNDRVVRVIHRPAGAPPLPQSLTVVARPADVKWKISDDGNDVLLTTPQVKVHVDKHTGRVRFLDDKDAPILSEAENGTWLTGASVGSAKETLNCAQRFLLDPKEAIFGLGQHPDVDGLNYVGNVVHLLQENTKVAVPVLLSSKGYAVLWDNPAVTDVDAGKTDKTALTWQSEAGFGVDYYVFQGPTPDEAIAGYRWLTGPAPMFGKWAWGFWQSRERYKTQEEVLGIVSEYRKRGIPFDGIIQDWQYWPPLNQETAEGGWGSHEFDPARYPDPAGMIKAIHDQHVHMLISVWAKFDVTDKGASVPHLKELEAVKGAYEPAIPFVYPPGRGKWYDPFNGRARDIYWKQLSRGLFSLGIDGWWLDASEAELSGKWGEFRDFTTGKGPGAVVFNAYPLEHTQAIYDGQRAENPDKRVFILTRSAYAGQQRNAAVTWSGDIRSEWDVFRKQIPAGLNFTASGIPYWNTDIGGFFGNNPDDPKFVERFVRWVQFGAFCPMFRVHGTDKPKEVWRFDDATQKILIDCINLRYHLLPYIYSVSWMVTNNGYTMMRPLVMDFQNDTLARAVPDQFMFGPALLVNPVTRPAAQMRRVPYVSGSNPVTGAGEPEREVYLPAGTKWMDFWTGRTFEGGQTIQAAAPIQTMPLFVRAGSILPYGPAIQYASEKPDEPVELRVYPGADGSFTLYEDEGDNYNYEKGAYATIPFHWDDKKKTLTIGERKGGFPGMQNERVFRVVWVSENHGAGTAPTEKPDIEVKYSGKEVTVSPGR